MTQFETRLGGTIIIKYVKILLPPWSVTYGRRRFNVTSSQKAHSSSTSFPITITKRLTFQQQVSLKTGGQS